MSETGTSTAASAATSSIEWVREFVERWREAWNSHDVDRLLALMSTRTSSARDDSWPKTMHGHSDVREFLNAIWRAMPDMTFDLLAGPYVIPGEPRAAFHWRGLWNAPRVRSEPPGFAPTGRRWELDGVDFHEYRDGRVSKLRIAFDMMSVSRQLGLMPESGSRAESALAMAQRSAARDPAGNPRTPRLEPHDHDHFSRNPALPPGQSLGGMQRPSACSWAWTSSRETP